MTEIVAVHGREILDSRGNPTVEVELATRSGFIGRASVPSGASTGQNEAVELRDGDDRYGGKGTRTAAENVDTELAEVVVGMDATDQRSLDLAMIEADGSDNKGRLGANALLGVSLAAAKAAAESAALPLYRYLGGAGAHTLPVPCCNIMNGGEHASNNVDFQEFMVVPFGFDTYAEALRSVAEIYQVLKKLLGEKGLSGGIGDEGGFAPDLESNGAALGLISEAIERSGYSLGDQIGFALDPAASEFYEDGSYKLSGEGKTHESDCIHSEKVNTNICKIEHLSCHGSEHCWIRVVKIPLEMVERRPDITTIWELDERARVVVREDLSRGTLERLWNVPIREDPIHS